MAKNEENWLTFFSELKTYIESHGHLPDKHVVENRGLVSKAKYLRKKIKTGKDEDWMVERFDSILAMRSGEHTGGRRKAADKGLKVKAPQPVLSPVEVAD